MTGPKSIAGILTSSNLLSSVEQMHLKHRAKMEAQALPGESVRDVEERLKAVEDAERRERMGPTQTRKPAPKQKTAMRRPPESDRQPDFLVPGLYDVATKDNRSLMDVAIYRLSKRDKQAGRVMRHNLSDGYVEVTAGPYGMATVWDYDIVLMMISHLTESMNLFNAGRGQMPGRIFVPHLTDITKFCRRAKGGRQADEIEAALDRLKGTTIKSVRVSRSRNGKGTEREVESEGLIARYKVVSRTDNGKVSAIEIEAPNWIYNEITTGPRPDVLTVHPDYFLIDLGLGRFVYRLARRAAGKTHAKWSFKTIYERSGSTGTFKEFSRMMRGLIAANDLPEYSLKMVDGQVGPLLLITRRDAAADAVDDSSDDAGDAGEE